MYCYGSYSNKGIKRFLEAQKKEYEIARKEIAQGKKESHWIWYIYPQIKGLGMSYMDQIYSIKSIQEGLEYKNDEILFKRLLEMTKLLLEIKHNNIKEVMWYPDDLKLRSCMTLFSLISDDKIFDKVIDKFYEGEKDLKTISILKDMLVKEEKNLESKFCQKFEKKINKIEKEELLKLKKKEEEEKIKKEKEREIALKKLKEKNETNNKKDGNSTTNNKINEINNKKIIKNKDNNKINEINKNNIVEPINKIDNSTLCKEVPMDLDEKSVPEKNKVINVIIYKKKKIENNKADSQIENLENKEPKDKVRNLKNNDMNKDTQKSIEEYFI